MARLDLSDALRTACRQAVEIIELPENERSAGFVRCSQTLRELALIWGFGREDATKFAFALTEWTKAVVAGLEGLSSRSFELQLPCRDSD